MKRKNLTQIVKQVSAKWITLFFSVATVNILVGNEKYPFEPMTWPTTPIPRDTAILLAILGWIGFTAFARLMIIEIRFWRSARHAAFALAAGLAILMFATPFYFLHDQKWVWFLAGNELPHRDEVRASIYFAIQAAFLLATEVALNGRDGEPVCIGAPNSHSLGDHRFTTAL